MFTPVSFSFQEEKLPNLPVSSAFGISSALHDYSGMSFAGQSVPFTQLLLVSQDGIFFEAGGSERAIGCTLTVAFLVLVFSFPLQMFATDILVQNFSFFEKHGNNKVATSLRRAYQHDSSRRWARSPRAVSCVFRMHVTNASSESSKLV